MTHFSVAVEAILSLDAAERKLLEALLQSIDTGTNQVPVRWTPEGSEE